MNETFVFGLISGALAVPFVALLWKMIAAFVLVPLWEERNAEMLESIKEKYYNDGYNAGREAELRQQDHDDTPF